MGAAVAASLAPGQGAPRSLGRSKFLSSDLVHGLRAREAHFADRKSEAQGRRLVIGRCRPGPLAFWSEQAEGRGLEWMSPRLSWGLPLILSPAVTTPAAGKGLPALAHPTTTWTMRATPGPCPVPSSSTDKPPRSLSCTSCRKSFQARWSFPVPTTCYCLDFELCSRFLPLSQDPRQSRAQAPVPSRSTGHAGCTSHLSLPRAVHPAHATSPPGKCRHPSNATGELIMQLKPSGCHTVGLQGTQGGAHSRPSGNVNWMKD